MARTHPTPQRMASTSDRVSPNSCDALDLWKLIDFDNTFLLVCLSQARIITLKQSPLPVNHSTAISFASVTLATYRYIPIIPLILDGYEPEVYFDLTTILIRYSDLLIINQEEPILHSLLCTAEIYQLSNRDPSSIGHT